jgi:hypothetical protein
MERNSAEQKGQGPPSSRRTNIRDGPFLFASCSEEFVHDEHRAEDPDRTIPPSPTEVASDGLYAAYGTSKERDGGEPGSRKEDLQQKEPTGRAQTPINPPSQKRSGPPIGSDVPPGDALVPNRPRRSRLATRKSKETAETSGRLHSHEVKPPRYAFPRHYWDKDWNGWFLCKTLAAYHQR